MGVVRLILASDKIGVRVVALIAVHVMNDGSFRQRATEDRFHDEDMLQDASVCAC